MVEMTPALRALRNKARIGMDVALFYAEHLREAARRGLLPADAAGWPGLEEFATRPGKTAAVTEARALLAALEQRR